MEQIESTKLTSFEVAVLAGVATKLTPYQMATLASRICPKLCVSDPKEAIAAAERLLTKASIAIDRARQGQDLIQHEAEVDERHDWVSAVKWVTGQKRRERALERFSAFMKHEDPEKAKLLLTEYKRKGMMWGDMMAYQDLFQDWVKGPKRKKGKQGRRISEHDQRLRTELVSLVPNKPRKRI